jgi:hypothetical protein
MAQKARPHGATLLACVLGYRALLWTAHCAALFFFHGLDNKSLFGNMSHVAEQDTKLEVYCNRQKEAEGGEHM